jgi:hypothetical protein
MKGGAMNNPVDVPPPGIDGSWRDSCVVCLKGTDTGIALRGEAEWVIAGLRVLGVPSDQASETLRVVTGSDPGMVPDGEVTITIRVCIPCAVGSPFEGSPQPVAIGVPLFGQKGG